ncbi:diacylglycerol kinase [Crocinitomix algicola]|uniref:diacylglycerol kinase n=1 Tax=Crocinitomix algicola TaxID=1740263 RepID=UPI0008723C54|nr:diacylglycerol kinase family protein [Crocinitomix algicola]
MKKQKSNIFRSFFNAFRGIYILFKTERNAQIHLAAIIVVGISGFYLAISSTDWLFVCSAITAVVVAEGFNTAIEKTLDFISTQENPKIGVIKDIAAGAVLLSALYAIIIAAIVFYPKLFL